MRLKLAGALLGLENKSHWLLMCMVFVEMYCTILIERLAHPDSNLDLKYTILMNKTPE